MSVTIKDIAKIAGVSIATVSKVINGKTHDISEATRKRVEQILKEENYIPNYMARSMRLNQTNTLGLIIPDIRNSFFTEIARGAEDESYEKGYSIIFANSDDSLSKEINHMGLMSAKQVDGILIAGSSERNPSKEMTLNLNTPAVAIDRMINYKFVVSTITTNNNKGAFQAVDFLIKNGHRKILHLAGPEDNVVSIARLNGYVQALIEHKIEYSIDDVLYGPFSTASAYDRLNEFDSLDDYTAIFASNDMIAFGALSNLQDRGISVPKDISLIGVDNVEHASLVYPALTTVDQSAYELGRIAARVMIDYLENKDIQPHYELDQTLIIRDSVDSIRK